jgi:hypothetical protein
MLALTSAALGAGTFWREALKIARAPYGGGARQRPPD